MGAKRGRSLAAGAIIFMLAAVGADAQQPSALARVQPGQWQLKEAGGATSRSLCIADPGVLLQLAHANAQCVHYVLDSAPGAITISYICPRAGHGRSVLTVHGTGEFRLQTQGLAGGAPFDFDYEARRTGDCGAAVPLAAAAKPAMH